MWADTSGDYSFDSGNDWLVTNLTHELSANLQTSPLLDDSPFDCDITENESNSMYHCDLNDYYDIKEIKEECEVELFKRESSPSSASSETSCFDRLDPPWNSKGDLDTPPITPPNVPSERMCVITPSGGSLFSMPVSPRLKHKVKFIAAKSSATPQSKSSPTPLTSDQIQEQQLRRKQERMIRNRESAYLSRKRAKEHVMQLETQVHDLTVENTNLKQENAALRERLGKYEPTTLAPKKVAWRKIPSVHKKTTAFLAIAVTVCINLNSMSLFDDKGLRRGDVTLEAAPNEHHSRSLLWVNSLDDSLLTNLTTSCPVAINHTESLRLERQLREWIVAGDVKNNLVPKQFKPNNSLRNANGRKKRIPRARRVRAFPLDMFGLPGSLLDLEGLYEAIHRRADTFYLVSFSADHLLLPAVASNATNQRPKMSLMLPAFLANASGGVEGEVEMMQIDCEVTNTQVLSVRGDDIPTHLRQTQHKFSNASITSSESSEGAGDYSISVNPDGFEMNLGQAPLQGSSGNYSMVRSRPSSYTNYSSPPSPDKFHGKQNKRLPATFKEHLLGKSPAFLMNQNISIKINSNKRPAGN